MNSAIWVYPWDILDDPAAADEIAHLGIERVSLAAAYHSTCAWAPHNPKRRSIDAWHAANYTPTDESRYANLRLQPASPRWMTHDDAFGEAREVLSEVGLSVNAWMVLLHNSRLGRAHPEMTIENAFGDRYVHALCPAQPEVRAYAEALVGDVSQRYELDGIELEAAGYMGYEHLSHHEKRATTLDAAHGYLLSVCWCSACTSVMTAYGLDVESLRDRVRRLLDSVMNAGPVDHHESRSVAEQILDLVGEDSHDALLAARRAVMADFLDAVLGALAPRRPNSVLLTGDPSPYATGAAVAVEPASIAARLDAILLPLFGLSKGGAVQKLGDAVTESSSYLSVVGGVAAYPPDVSSSEQLIELRRLLSDAGADGLRYYHYGLCPRANLQWIAEAEAARL